MTTKDRHLFFALEKSVGPKLLVMGGMHGNEHSGPQAMQRVAEKLRDRSAQIRGSIYFILGNLEALQRNERFVDVDLNRIWRDDLIREASNAKQYDFKELAEIHALIEKICRGNYKDCILLDLHTFSADSGLFCIPAENPPSEKLARSFGVPYIEKLARSLPETALNYYGEKGMTSVVFEGGKHNTAEATDNLERAIWITLEQTGIIRAGDFPFVGQMKKYLEKISHDLPHRLEMVYRHKLEDYHHYRMNEGYYNFKSVRQGEPVARQNGREVVSPYGGFMLMPLYQAKGSDGFFIVQERGSRNNKTN